ncbi:hypothetical protein SAMD00019534_115560 [Acytostelium subglobosum LB1]|uniref:hypothetical protein n=1 Tax=Acytostelium subglobosum LB1 TaxID=1410327 RepID=UPI000644BD61|nr:hypothetical protein SAMD00019534_115560 [Acytostelium subglobosum LB1]GAM28380.1 hypothetical protein SAMD00019534_115560 [Acytostelium subglobosum LB1]|eukprot:XP_012748697.1 hypothetical protein SAMD00019534_115560 [Acytostelium subglobosum LB1]
MMDDLLDFASDNMFTDDGDGKQSENKDGTKSATSSSTSSSSSLSPASNSAQSTSQQQQRYSFATPTSTMHRSSGGSASYSPLAAQQIPFGSSMNSMSSSSNGAPQSLSKSQQQQQKQQQQSESLDSNVTCMDGSLTQPDDFDNNVIMMGLNDSTSIDLGDGGVNDSNGSINSDGSSNNNNNNSNNDISQMLYDSYSQDFGDMPPNLNNNDVLLSSPISSRPLKKQRVDVTQADDQAQDSSKAIRRLPTWMGKKMPSAINDDVNEEDLKKQHNNKSKTKKDKVASANPSWIKSLRGFTEVEEPPVESRVVCFDLETSGFGPEDSIIEIGAVELINGCRTGLTFQSYAKPKNVIHPAAQEIHRLSSFLLQSSPPIEYVLASFLDFVGDSPLVAHNLAFDRRMLIQEMMRCKIPVKAEQKCFCTMRYFRRMYRETNYSLDSVSQRLNINKLLLRRTHGALVDSEILAIVYNHLVSLPANFANLRLLKTMDDNNKASTTSSSTSSDNVVSTNQVVACDTNNNNNNTSSIMDSITNGGGSGDGCLLDHLDHIVLTTKDLDSCVQFYTKVLGLRMETFGENRVALKFGNQKINVHIYGKEFKPHASLPTPGSLDLCFISSVPIRETMKRLFAMDVNIEEGPVPRTGAMGKILSVYIRDPDNNLIEIAEQLKE